jgi:hypothetical protein
MNKLEKLSATMIKITGLVLGVYLIMHGHPGFGDGICIASFVYIFVDA